MNTENLFESFDKKLKSRGRMEAYPLLLLYSFVVILWATAIIQERIEEDLRPLWTITIISAGVCIVFISTLLLGHRGGRVTNQGIEAPSWLLDRFLSSKSRFVAYEAIRGADSWETLDGNISRGAIGINFIKSNGKEAYLALVDGYNIASLEPVIKALSDYGITLQPSTMPKFLPLTRYARIKNR